MTSVEEAFEQFKKLPDWDRYPMPDIFYKHFNVKKPKEATVSECANYFPPAYLPLGNGKVEIIPPREGGVRKIDLGPELPVKVEMIEDEKPDVDMYIPDMKIITQTSDDTKQDSGQNSLSLPTEHNNSETQPLSDRQSPSPYDASLCISDDAPCPDAEYSPASQKPQSLHSSLAQYQTETPLSTSSQP